ncbi:MAG: hypothetical protein NWT12_12065, partial [Paracoccaceae bacterium]|nr:hypothetical protein [Paracoccaceae bacterium]
MVFLSVQSCALSGAFGADRISLAAAVQTGLCGGMPVPGMRPFVPSCRAPWKPVSAAYLFDTDQGARAAAICNLLHGNGANYIHSKLDIWPSGPFRDGGARRKKGDAGGLFGPAGSGD